MSSVAQDRAALVTEQFAREIVDAPTVPGREAMVITACATTPGAVAFLTRVAPLARRGLRLWRLTDLLGELELELGDTVALSGSAFGAAEGGDYVVVGRDRDANTGAIAYALRGG